MVEVGLFAVRTALTVEPVKNVPPTGEIVKLGTSTIVLSQTA